MLSIDRRAIALFAIGALAACDMVGLEEEVVDVEAAPIYEQISIVRRDLRIAVEAAGVVEPVTTVEVKSKASGEILELNVDTGDRIDEGALLARIDQRVLNNTLEQAKASLEVAEARLANAESQLERVESLYERKAVSKSDYEMSTLEHATAKSEVVRSEIQVENAVIQLGDSDVLAPISGTIIERAVEQGTVISSPMGSVSGGTLLLKMADLSRVQVRMLVDEIDIGKVQPGVLATVVVAAFPSRPFRGEVIKVEPQAVDQQNVTMFPVLIDIDNREGLLKPGMNADVEVVIDERNGVLVVPNAALRTEADVEPAGSVLGFAPDEVREMLAASTLPARSGSTGEGSANAGPGELSAEDRQRMAALREKFQRGEQPDAEDRALMQKMRASGRGPGGRPGGQRNARQRPRAMGGDYIVFAERAGEVIALRVRTGITDMERSEVIAGLEEGDAVLILPSASLVRAQDQFRERMSGRMGIPGLSRGR